MNFKSCHQYNNLRTRIKVCGITRLHDAFAAIDAGADALGFVFYKNSPRFITPNDAADIIKRLPPFVASVGLFVNAGQSEIDEVLNVAGIDVIQLHGDEMPSFCAAQNKVVIKALPIATSADLTRITDYPCSVLLDAKAPEGVYGGTGQTFDWSILGKLVHDFPLILAGGLQPDNIQEALALRHWFAVDVSSGVEAQKGIKSKEKIDLFCKRVHQFNGKV